MSTELEECQKKLEEIKKKNGTGSEEYQRLLKEYEELKRKLSFNGDPAKGPQQGRETPYPKRPKRDEP